jgi:hypothetical protein
MPCVQKVYRFECRTERDLSSLDLSIVASDQCSCVDLYLSLQKRSLSRPSVLFSLLGTGWTVRGSNPGGGGVRFSRTSRLWRPPDLLCNGYRVSFTGVKAAGACR